jgi:hypothetical protein
MFSKTHFILVLLGAVHTGCGLPDDHKTACSLQGDCLDGFACVNHVCTRTTGMPDAGGPGPGNGGDPPDPQAWESGTVVPIAIQTSGLAAVNGNTSLLGITSLPDNLGCALVGSESTSPGVAAAVLHVSVAASSDARCPAGTTGLRYDLPACNPHALGGPLTRCGVYRRWDASGQLVAERLALGGSVTARDITVDASTHRCEVELIFNFGGTTSIQRSFAFTFQPGAPTETFCLH